MNTGSTTSYRRADGETTEWEDILRSKGIIPPKVSAAEEERAREDALAEAIERAQASVDVLAGKTLGELDALEEEDDEFADSRVLEGYRAARIAELQAAAQRNKYGMVRPCAGDGGGGEGRTRGRYCVWRGVGMARCASVRVRACAARWLDTA